MRPSSMSQERQTGSVSYFCVSMFTYTHRLVVLLVTKRTGVQVRLVPFLGPIKRIANDMGSKDIIVILDTFILHTCRFTALLEIVTNLGSQFLNQRLMYHNEDEFKHKTTIPTLTIRTVFVE